MYLFEPKSSLQVNLRRAFGSAAAWPGSNYSAMHLAFALLWQLFRRIRG